MSAATFDAQAAANDVVGNRPPPPLIDAKSIEVRPVNWLWHPYLPGGMINIIAAPGGAGKGLVCVELTKCISIGAALPCSDVSPMPGNVLWCEAEDPLREVVAPRLIAAGADRERVQLASREAFLELDIRKWIAERGGRLIVLSPMVSFLKVTDINGELDVRAVLERLQAAIEGTNCAVVGIAHTNKKADLPAIDRVMGSAAWVNFTRSVMLVAPDKETEGWSRLVHAKCNLSVRGDDLLYRVEHVGQDPRDQFVKLNWSRPDNGNIDADAIFERRRRDAGNGHETAGQWLVSYLREHGECLRADVVLAGARFGHKEETLKKAHQRNQAMQSRREGFQGPVYWSIS